MFSLYVVVTTFYYERTLIHHAINTQVFSIFPTNYTNR